MKIKTKSIQKKTTIILPQKTVEKIAQEYQRYTENPNSTFHLEIMEDESNLIEFVLEEDVE